LLRMDLPREENEEAEREREQMFFRHGLWCELSTVPIIPRNQQERDVVLSCYK
jgi:hypothetical protein